MRCVWEAADEEPTFVRFSHAAAKCNTLRPKLSLCVLVCVCVQLYFCGKANRNIKLQLGEAQKYYKWPLSRVNQSHPPIPIPIPIRKRLKLVSLLELRFEYLVFGVRYSILGIGSLAPCRLSSNQLCNRCS